MEGDQTIRDAIEAFMHSDLAETVIRPGQEISFAQQVERFIETLSVEQWEAEPAFLGIEIGEFLEHEIHTGHLQEMGGIPERDDDPSVAEHASYEATFTALYEMASAHLEGQSFDRGLEPAESPEAATVDASTSIADRLHALLQTVKDFVQGYQPERPSRDHDLER